MKGRNGKSALNSTAKVAPDDLVNEINDALAAGSRILDPAEVERPAHLTKDQLHHFNDVVKKITTMSVLREEFVPLIAVYAQSMDELIRLQAFVTKNGHSYETENAAGSRMIKQRPEAKALAETRRTVHSLLAEFGLTPLQLAKNYRIHRDAKKAEAKAATPSGKFGRFKR
jgi:P27 family predicted phage terminase small subunit